MQMQKNLRLFLNFLDLLRHIWSKGTKFITIKNYKWQYILSKHAFTEQQGRRIISIAWRPIFQLPQLPKVV